MACYEIKNLTFSYPEQEKKALDHVNLIVEPGEFIALCGKSGCGKSTLMRQLKTVMAPHGKKSGEIRFFGKPLEEVRFRDQASQIGYVLQNPDNQIVTDKVWHELAFGLESLGTDNHTIRLRVAEMASYFGIQTWFMKNVTELSGGQKQLLNLASIMAMQPSVLLLDEPTSQLDPIAAADFLATIRKINREVGTTVIIIEHRLEDVVPYADRVVVMENGTIIADDAPRDVGSQLKTTNNDMFVAMPSPMQIYAAVDSSLECPLTVREGRSWLSEIFKSKKVKQRGITDTQELNHQDPIIRLKEVWFRYEKDGNDIVKGVSVDIPKASLFCIVGGNGTGKSTTLKIMSGILRPYRGKVLINGKDIKKYTNRDLFVGNLAVLPQDPQSLFVKKTVELDLWEMMRDKKIPREEQTKQIRNVAELVEITDLLQMHPYDISGGEQQRAALAKVLLLEPKILLLDEPTKGLDNYFKIKLAEILRKLIAQGVTVVMVSHDIEFCARYGDSCSMFFDGDIVTTDTPNRFFSGNSFYTTSANRLSRHIFTNAVNNEDVIELCRQNLQIK
ncbi:MAG TPA: ATP-binding cassette domain-containing protein [Firmicutes bacterium]|nr:ATP-binding cassette domain-containing protein [Bacillota bacterium]